MTGSVYAKLQHLWELFVQAPSTEYSRSCWLDLFLAEFLNQVKNGASITNLLSFWPAGQASIATLIGCDLLQSVHQICGHTDELRPVRNLLLKERGWRCLAVLHLLSLQGICCGRELTTLLISLYPICMDNTDEESSTKNGFIKPRPTNIDQTILLCNSVRPKSPHRKTSLPEYSSSSSRRSKPSTSGSDSSDTETDHSLRRSFPLKIQLNPQDFDYYTSKETDYKTPELFEPGKYVNSTDDLTTPELNVILQLGISKVEFGILVVQLLQSLCFLEDRDNIQCLNFALENLSRKTELKSELTELLLIALERSGKIPDNIVTRMIEILEDFTNKHDDETSQNDVVFGVLYGFLQLLYQQLHQKWILDKFREFMDTFQLFGQSQNGKLIENTIGVILKKEGSVTFNRVKKIIDSLGHLILLLKKTRADITHHQTCPKTKHKKCRKTTQPSHHHQNHFGTPSCAISTLFLTLLRLLDSPLDKDLHLRLVKTMIHSGTCCCFPSDLLMTHMIRILKTGSNRSLVFTLLERILYTELGGTSCTRTHSIKISDYFNLVNSSDTKLSYETISHLLRIAPKSTPTIRSELLFTIFFPTFTKVRHDEKFKILSCLNIFASLLNTIPFAEQFMQLDGLTRIRSFITNSEYSKACCAVLENTIIIELWRMECDLNSENIRSTEPPKPLILDDLTKLPSLQMFVSALQTFSNDFVAEDEWFSAGEEPKSPERGCQMEVLFNCSVFWRSLANLCLYSPHLRGWVNGKVGADQVLQVVLGRVCKVELRERRLLLKLLEAVVTVKLIGAQDWDSICHQLRTTILSDPPTGVGSIPELCDVLLRCATLRPSLEQVMPPHSKPKVPLFGNWEAKEITRRFSDSSLGEAYLTADDGYEADVEVPANQRKYEVVDSYSSGEDQLPPSDPSPTFAEYCRTKLIIYPGLCLLSVDLLVILNQSDNRLSEDILLCLQRLLTLCRDNPHNCISLAYAGTTGRLLTGFKNSLISSSHSLIEIQHSILELITLLSKHSITRSELSLYLQLFKSPNPPLTLLLEPLVALATSSRPQPNHILCFPSICYETLKKSVLNENAALHLANNLRSQHSESSAWSNYAVCLPINNDMGWSMWSHGYSLCFWMRHERPGSAYAPKRDSMLGQSVGPKDGMMMHLVSVGNDALVVEMWAETGNDQIVFKITRPEPKQNRIIAEKAIPNCLPTGQWHHLALNVQDVMEKRKILISITLLINGWKEYTIKLPLIGLLPKIKRTCILLGQTIPSAQLTSSWFFGNMMVFRVPVFTKERAIYLVGLGPNYTSLTECEVGKRVPNFTAIFGPRNISSVIDWDGILDAGGGNLKELQDNLLLGYNSQNPSVVNVYPQIVHPGLFSTQPGFRVNATDQRACQQLPLALAPGFTGPLVPQHFQGLAAAAALLGGVPIFMFLVARVVELDSTPEEQALALRLLLRLIQIDSELHSQFTLQDGYNLLLRILACCKPSHDILKSILDICCDKSILHHANHTALTQTDAIIVNPFLIKTALRATWESDAFPTLLEALHALLRDDHPFREFNASQLNRIHLVDSILSQCKEHFLYSQSILPSQISCSLVELIHALMGAPPEFVHIVAITDFLLLLHEASATYVTHVRSSFYYLLTDASSSLPLDPRKLNKALANLQIQKKSRETDSESDFVMVDHPDQNIDVIEHDEIPRTPEYPTISGIQAMKLFDRAIKDEGSEKGSVKSGGNGAPKTHWLVSEGLLLSLRDTLLVLPDPMSSQVFCHVVKPEVLLVMANHSSPAVRTALVKVLGAFLQRASEEELTKLIKNKYFYHLANQLSLFPASKDLVTACGVLVTRCTASLDEQMELTNWNELSAIQLAALSPLLALLPNTIHDLGLTKELLGFITIIFTRASTTFKTLLDKGAVEVLLRTLTELTRTKNAVLHDIIALLVSISSKCLCLSGTQNLQFVLDMHLQLYYLSLRNPDCPLREQQCAIFDGQLDALQERITSNQGFKLRTTASYLASVLSTGYEESRPIRRLSGSLLLGGSKELPKAELSDRFKTLLIKVVEFLVNTEPMGDIYPTGSITETKLIRRVYLTLLQGLTSVWGSRGTLRKPTADLTTWLLTPGQPVKLRMFVIYSLREETNSRDVISLILQGHYEQKFTVFLWDLMYGNGSNLSAAELQTCEELKEDLQCWGILSPHCVGHAHDQWGEEVRLLKLEAQQDRSDWMKSNGKAIYRSLYKNEGITKSLMEGAMSITRNVVESQNRERKSFMEYMKLAYTKRLNAKIRWQCLIGQLTHERAVWYFPDSYPQSWQLDPTEGPHRVRKRLQRCHLNINERFLLPEQQAKLQTVKTAQPLAYLMKLEQQSSASSLLIERLHTSEKVRHMATAQVITPALELPGELLIGETCLHFVPDDASESHESFEITPTSSIEVMAWQFDNIREIHNRRFQLQERALEVFLTNGKTYLVAFPTSKDRDDFVVQLGQCHLPNRIQQGDILNDCIQVWRSGLLTNWEYVMQLNKMSGRSYNDLMQYPVFPFVLSDYISENLDLRDSKIYRCFERPMAVQDKSNEQHYINNYNYLKQAITEGMNSISLNQEPYHYGSHYSNSGTVLHFLVRLPPFTKMFLSYQDNNFDIPDRTFHALHTTWRLTSCDSTTDVKELIPEFFYLPEFLENGEGFNLGVRQNGERVNDVLLPPWSKGSARLFTLVHRQALESDYVRENIPYWIDLVFGYKQTGKAAVDAINVFHPATYYGFNVDKICDPIERNAWETMVRTYGQTPRQLFRTPHPMVVQPLTNSSLNTIPPVLEGVKGLRWGSYVGSPEQPGQVVAIWKRQHRSPIATLVPISSNDVYGLPPHTAILLGYGKEKDVTVVGTVPVAGSALITWGHSDNMVRIKLKKEHPPWPLVQSPVLDPMIICASVPDLPQLWLGHNSGSIHVYSYTLWPDRGQLDLKPEPAILLGHTAAVTTLGLCPAFSIAVSGSQDGTAIIWDINTLSYVRSIETKNRDTPVQLVTISDTLGDIALASNAGSGSILSVYTINCTPVAEISIPERITAMCYSSAPEGVSVNVLATGFDSGVVRLWSSWDLRPVRDIVSATLHHPIISIAYSSDSQHLFVSASDGTVIIWENATGPGRTPKFLNLTSL